MLCIRCALRGVVCCCGVSTAFGATVVLFRITASQTSKGKALHKQVLANWRRACCSYRLVRCLTRHRTDADVWDVTSVAAPRISVRSSMLRGQVGYTSDFVRTQGHATGQFPSAGQLTHHLYPSLCVILPETKSDVPRETELTGHFIYSVPSAEYKSRK